VAYLDRPTWRADIEDLAKLTAIDTTTYDGFLEAMRSRRAAFVAAGARATDHGHLLADTTPMEASAARQLYARVLGGAEPSQADVDAFAANMLYQMAEMSCEDGLVMQIHPGVLRNHNSAIFSTYGLDKGYDIPITTEFTRALRPMLDRFGTDPRFRVILFTVDETVYSRELAPIAGTYPSVRLGAPWWFPDSPEGMRRFREFATETAGFYNTSGFVDDTRAFASIPARHDLFRRVDAGYLARLVLEHRLSLDEAVETAIDLTYHLPQESYPRPDTSRRQGQTLRRDREGRA
jgi:glucuronate isomerase